MRPTLELLDPLHPLRWRSALWLLPPGGSLALVAYGASRPVGLDPVDRVFLPLLVLGFFGLALAQFFGANLAYVGLLYMLVRIKEGYLEAQLDAYTDFLTGLRNRRYLEPILEKELFRVERYGRPLCLMVLDLDGFKRINDTHGHEVGDRVLKALAACLEGHIRQSDRAVRLGGEEFAVLLPETQLAQALALAERLRQAVAALKVPPAEALSASFGVVQATPTDSPLSLLKRADEAMYRAKRRGKNRVEAG